MKTFIYKETAHHNEKRNNRELNIYLLKNNTPQFIDTIYYTTASTQGAKAEILQHLIKLGYIPKKYYYSSVTEWSGAGYYDGEVTEKYKIIEV